MTFYVVVWWLMLLFDVLKLLVQMECKICYLKFELAFWYFNFLYEIWNFNIVSLRPTSDMLSWSSKSALKVTFWYFGVAFRDLKLIFDIVGSCLTFNVIFWHFGTISANVKLFWYLKFAFWYFILLNHYLWRLK